MESTQHPRLDVVDLTAPLTTDLWRYDEAFPAFESMPLTTRATDGFEMSRLTLGTHMGTHSDSGSHLIPGGWTLDELGLGPYIGPVTVLALGGRPLQEIEAADLQLAAAEGIPPGDGVLLSTGWDANFGSATYATHHPFLTEGAADWLVMHGVRIVAADLPGLMDPRIDLRPPTKPEATADGRLLQARIPYVVGLVNVSDVDRRRVTLVALPLRIEGADGAPVRAVALRDL